MTANGNVYLHKTSGTEIIVDNLLMDIGDEHPIFSVETYLDSIYEKQILGCNLEHKGIQFYVVISFA